ncbi:hypothetical protein B296_00045847 [Ensete ventricosum]|uniref:SPX domain-containing protein n=1 Tax=Ensete ventricosum TaxID=4639 RepID=A0A426YQX4_ENSVE|nr:hypothetical protein B296_00045847 [Ensete ventricosum]
MVKFSRELQAQLIPEWKDAFVDYRQLKKHVKKIKLSLLRSSLPNSSSSDDHHNGGGGFSLFDPVRAFAARFSAPRNDHPPPVKEFLEKLEQELEKVNGFYTNKENEFCDRGEILSKQLQILVDLKQLLHEHRRRRRHQRSAPPSPAGGSVTSLLSSASSFSGA